MTQPSSVNEISPGISTGADQVKLVDTLSSQMTCDGTKELIKKKSCSVDEAKRVGPLVCISTVFMYLTHRAMASDWRELSAK